jgi:hypothetical protein
MLADAVRIVKSGCADGAEMPALRAAREWLRADDFDWPFSFVNVCNALGCDPQVLRRSLAKWL